MVAVVAHVQLTFPKGYRHVLFHALIGQKLLRQKNRRQLLVVVFEELNTHLLDFSQAVLVCVRHSVRLRWIVPLRLLLLVVDLHLVQSIFVS